MAYIEDSYFLLITKRLAIWLFISHFYAITLPMTTLISFSNLFISTLITPPLLFFLPAPHLGTYAHLTLPFLWTPSKTLDKHLFSFRPWSSSSFLSPLLELPWLRIYTGRLGCWKIRTVSTHSSRHWSKASWSLVGFTTCG